MPRAQLLLAALALAACSRADAQPAPPPAAAAPPPAPPAPASPAPAAPASPPADATPAALFPNTTHYRVVLHTGDSMVGGGLSRALRPLFATEGSKFVRDVWESGSIENFADSDRLPTLLARHDPDLVLLTMGANDVGGNITDYLGKKIDRVVAMTQKKKARDCIWIGPPKWKVNGKPVIDMIKAHVAPCVFFDATNIEMERKEDKVHPNEHGGEQWATALWYFLRGTDHLPAGADGGAIFPLPVP